MHWLNGLAVKLGDKDMPDSAKNALGSAFEDVRQAHLDAAFTEPDGGVEAGEAVEAHLDTDALLRLISEGPPPGLPTLSITL